MTGFRFGFTRAALPLLDAKGRRMALCFGRHRIYGSRIEWFTQEVLQMTGQIPLFQYTCWGLRICSELPCPELLSGSGDADAYIRLGRTPAELNAVNIKGACFEVSREQFLLKVAGVANYWVKQGREIVVEPFASAESKEVRLFLLGSAFGALLHQRGLPPFHGSAVAMGDKAVLFVGPSASGKSTLCAELCRRGHSFLADDVCVLRLENSLPPSVLPAYPQTKLWADALTVLERDKKDLRRVRANMEKYALPLGDSFCPTDLPLAAVFILKSSNEDSIEIEPITGQDKFIALNNNTYRLRFLEGLGDKSAHYRTCASIARHARVVSVRRPREPFMLRELADMIERECPV